MASAIAPSSIDQQSGYMPASYQTGMPAVPSPSKSQSSAICGVPQVQNGMEKGGEAGKDGQAPYSWAAAMEAYYKTGPQSHGHPGSYYGAPMAPAHHAYMWGAQPMMPPYGAPTPSPYSYGAMYPPQHPAMATHAHPTTAYGYSATPQGQVKDVTAMAVPVSMGGAAAAVASPMAAGPGVQDQSTTDVSSGGTEGGVRPNKRSYETLTSNDAMATMAAAANSGAPSQYGYNSDMWTMAAPMQRTQSSGGLNAEVAPMTYQVEPLRHSATPRDEREVKRQRRKQSNRESARRSRLRKQAEAEDLGTRVSSMVTDNATLRQEVAQLQERCSQLAAHNARLREEAKAAGITLEPLEVQLQPTGGDAAADLPPASAPEADSASGQISPQAALLNLSAGDASKGKGELKGRADAEEDNKENISTPAQDVVTPPVGTAEAPAISTPSVKEEAPPSADRLEPVEAASTVTSA